VSKKQADLLIVGANELLTIQNMTRKPKTKEEMNDLGIIINGALAVKDGKIAAVGITNEIERWWRSDHVISAGGKVVMPGFVDCHTHLIFAGSREEEFALKIRGVAYLDILQKGGGILKTVRETRAASENVLLEQAEKRLSRMLKYGTTTVEIKSGYCLSCEEIKILKVAALLKQRQKMDILITFLGAHVFPDDIYSRLYMEDIFSLIEYISSNKLADYCDVFCEKNAFLLKDTEAVLEYATKHGMKIKMHVGQFNDIGGVGLGLKYGAVSIDHLDYVSDGDIQKLAQSGVVGVLLPAVSFHLMLDHYAPARKMLDVGMKIALATDFNPGSSPTMSMQMIIALACRQMKMTAGEAITAATINAAYAIGKADYIGSLEEGKQADIIILGIPNYLQLPYWFGGNLVEAVIKKGKVVSM